MGGGGTNNDPSAEGGGGGKGGGITVSMALSDASAATAPPQDKGRGAGDITGDGGHAVKPVQVQQPTPELPQERNPSRENEGKPRSVNARRGSMVMGRQRRGAGASGTILTDPLGVGDNTGSTILG